VLDAATGRVSATIDLPGSLPRETGWRSEPRYRTAVEGLAASLAEAMPLTGSVP